MSGITPQEVFETFSQYDDDGSGTISAQELAGALEKILGTKPSEAEIADMMKEYDADGDGQIGLIEFAAFAGLSEELDKWRELFNSVDDDGSGHIEEAELKAVFEKTGSPNSQKDVDDMYKKAHKKKGESFNVDEFISVIVFDAPLKRQALTVTVPPLTQERVDELVAMFNKFDVDGDGKISKKELKPLLTEQWGREPSTKEVTYVMNKVDSDHSHEISKAEFLRMMGHAHEIHVFKKTFTKFDKDGSGKLEKEELIEALAHLGAKDPKRDARLLMRTKDGKRKKYLNFETFLDILLTYSPSEGVQAH